MWPPDDVAPGRGDGDVESRSRLGSVDHPLGLTDLRAGVLEENRTKNRHDRERTYREDERGYPADGPAVLTHEVGDHQAGAPLNPGGIQRVDRCAGGISNIEAGAGREPRQQDPDDGSPGSLRETAVPVNS